MNGADGVRELTCDEVREMAGAFVLGALDAADEAAVREHLVSCPEAHEEIAELGGVLPALAESVSVVEPPDALKGRIMAAAAADLAGRSAVTAEPTPFPVAGEREARKRRASTGSWILRIAAVIAIVALGSWNLLLQNQLTAAQSYQQAVAQVLAVAGRPGSLTAVLTADGGTGSGLAAVSAGGQLTIAMQHLAPTSGKAVYEAWVVAGSGTPVPLGSFQVGSGGTGTFATGGVPTTAGIVLGLTLEPAPGATSPTLPMVSQGVATPAG